MSEVDALPPFSNMGLLPELIKSIQDIGYETPSPIQLQSIPHILNGNDLLGLAQTGTGKTAAFALPLLTKLNLSKKKPQIMILTPTRELAIQVSEAFKEYAKYMKDFYVLSIYGGQDMGSQLRALKKGVQVVVGTPGRIMDHMRRGSLTLDHLSSIVLDEADEMLRMGFVEDIEWVMEKTPKSCQVALFSATMPSKIMKIADIYLKNPITVKIKAKTATVDTIKQKLCIVNGYQKLDALTRIIDVENFDAMIIFVRTKTATVELAEKLDTKGFCAAALNGDMSQVLREKVIHRLKKGTLDILIATDVAARGLDVERISHVLNYDIPHDTEAYVHRVGRTGRAGRAGIAILFATNREQRMLRAIEKETNQKIEVMQLPSMKDVRAKRITEFKAEAINTVKMGKEYLNDFYKIINDINSEIDEKYDIQDLAAAICYMAQKSKPFPDEKEDLKLNIRSKGFDSLDSESKNSQRERPKNRPRIGNRNKDSRDQFKRSENENMIRFRVEVGRNHGLQPSDLVGAIANEGKISGRNIGHIRLFDKFSTVYLPNNIDQKIITLLKNVKVRSQPLGISKWAEKPQDDKGINASRRKEFRKRPERTDKKRNYSR